MLTTFDEIIEVTLHHEGGYVHDPKDLGGETNFGMKDLNRCGYKEPNQRCDKKEDYKKDYWMRTIKTT